jgi:prevent-host-death family protein
MIIGPTENAGMAKRVNAAQAKARLSALMAAVAYGGERYIIERRGKPLAALVSVAELEQLEQEAPGTRRPTGFLAMAGAWRGLMDDAEIDEMVAHVYAERERDLAAQ